MVRFVPTRIIAEAGSVKSWSLVGVRGIRIGDRGPPGIETVDRLREKGDPFDLEDPRIGLAVPWYAVTVRNARRVAVGGSAMP